MGRWIDAVACGCFAMTGHSIGKRVGYAATPMADVAIRPTMSCRCNQSKMAGTARPTKKIGLRLPRRRLKNVSISGKFAHARLVFYTLKCELRTVFYDRISAWANKLPILQFCFRRNDGIEQVSS